jgi:hypothetical protein
MPHHLGLPDFSEIYSTFFGTGSPLPQPNATVVLETCLPSLTMLVLVLLCPGLGPKLLTLPTPFPPLPYVPAALYLLGLKT